MERFAELLGCAERSASIQFICEYDFNIFQFNCPISLTLFCDEKYLFVLNRFVINGRYIYRATMTAFLIKDLESDFRNELPQIMETHRNNKITTEHTSIIDILLCPSDMIGEVILTEKLWERFYNLALGTTRCKSARNFL